MATPIFTGEGKVSPAAIELLQQLFQIEDNGKIILKVPTSGLEIQDAAGNSVLKISKT